MNQQFFNIKMNQSFFSEENGQIVYKHECFITYSFRTMKKNKIKTL
jgi:hypothetical protein